MHFATGCLPDDTQPRRPMRLQDRVGTAWQGIGAMRGVQARISQAVVAVLFAF